MSQKLDKKIRKAQKAVHKQTAEQLTVKAKDILDEMRYEKWRYRLLMAVWLILPNFKKREEVSDGDTRG
jgi:hypothetical protein